MICLILKNWTFRKMLSAQLVEEGFEVNDSESVDKPYDTRGNDFLQQRKCALIVIDLLDGGYTNETLHDLRKSAEGTPFLVLRGESGHMDVELKEEGFHHILKRPLSIGTIVQEIKNVCNKSSR
jgi:DNA-binding response OmpR family regulator